MPNSFPAFLSAIALSILVSQPNLAHAQIVVSNGTTVGQQTLGPGQSILVEQGGAVSETDTSAVNSSNSNINILNNGDIDSQLVSTAVSGTNYNSIDMTGTLNTIVNNGSIAFSAENSAGGVSFVAPLGSTGAIRMVGDSSLLDNTGSILAELVSLPNVAGCTFFQCNGAQLGEEISSVHAATIIGNNSTIINDGSIKSIIGRPTTDSSTAISIDGNNNTITNTGTIELEATPGSNSLEPTRPPFTLGGFISYTNNPLNQIYHHAVRLYGDNNIVLNTGVISARDFADSNNVIGIDSYFSDTTGNIIENYGLIESDAVGVFILDGTVNNYGTINGGRTSYSLISGGGVILAGSDLFNYGEISGLTEAVATENPFNYTSSESNISNFGSISGTFTGVGAYDGTLNLVNFGSITGNLNGIQNGTATGGGSTLFLENYGIIRGGSDGVISRKTIGHIVNAGEISGTVTGINVDGVSGLTLENSGEIFGATAISAGREFSIDNSGSIFSTLGPTGYAFLLSPPDNVLGAGTTLELPNDDEILFRAGTRIIGRMYMGANSFLSPTLSNGNDTITLDRTAPDIAWRWTFDNFDLPGQDPFDAGGIGDSLFILGNNVPYYIWNGPVTGDYGPFPSEGGITVYIPNISGIFAANGIMEDIARTVHGGIRNRLNEGWDHENLPQELFYRSEDDIVLRDGSELIGAPLEALDPAVFRKAPPLTVWAKGFGGIRNEAGTANYGDYSHLWMGGMAGLDLRSSQGDENDDGLRDTEDDNHWNIGVLGGYVQSDLTFASGFKDIQSDFFFAGAYGRLVRDALYLDASIIGGFGGMSEYGPIANNLVPGGIENPGEGYSTDGRFISPSASIGKRFYITDTISFTPEINATYLAQWIDGSTSPLTLSIEDRFIDTVFGHVQGSVKKVIKRDNSTIIGELRGGLYMSRQLHGDETNLSVVSNQFTIDTSREDVVSPYVGIGATWEIADNFKLSADGEMDFGDLDGGRARIGASLGF